MNFSVYNSTFPIEQFYANMVRPNGNYTKVPQFSDAVSINRNLDKYLSVNKINEMINANPVIIKLLNEQGIKPTINIENFKKTTYNHSIQTKNFASGIYNYLPAELKAEANISAIQEGALLHDIGKVLIPERILNKQDKLNEKETEIMHLHSRLSEALLSTQNIKPEVLNIVKYHHQTRKNNGYPEIKNTNLGFDINTEIVAVADKFSALKEARSYKTEMSNEDALTIIKKSVDAGEIDYRVYNALVGYINNTKAADKKVSSAANVA